MVQGIGVGGELCAQDVSPGVQLQVANAINPCCCQSAAVRAKVYEACRRMHQPDERMALRWFATDAPCRSGCSPGSILRVVRACCRVWAAGRLKGCARMLQGLGSRTSQGLC